MARPGVKKLQETIEESVKILCRYCDVKGTCDRKVVKEQYEEAGFITRCAITPNRPKKKRK